MNEDNNRTIQEEDSEDQRSDDVEYINQVENFINELNSADGNKSSVLDASTN